MIKSKYQKMLLILVVIVLLLGNFNITIADANESNDLSIDISRIMTDKSDYEKIEQPVVNLIKGHDRFSNFNNKQINNDFDLIDNKVRLELILSNENKINRLKNFDENIEIENYYKSLVQVLVPIESIHSLSKEDFVLYIRKPIEAYPLDITSEGVSVIGADLVHNEGVFGAGTKVAVIDLGFQNYLSNPELPSERIAEVHSFRADGDIECGEVHGCACAEIILDVAPQADLYLYNFDTISELNDAVSHAIFVGVDVISFSIGYVNINDYDGIGYAGIGDVCGIVDNARSNDILFIASSGNQANRHYEGTFTDTDGDNFHEFDTPYETLVLDYIPTGEIVHVALSWDDWPSSDQDYDLYLVDSSLNIVGYSLGVQTGSQSPTEMIARYVPYGDNYQVVIYRYSSTINVHFELYSFYNNFLTSNCPESSLLCPADAYGSMTASATYWQNDNLEPFSSRGPTNDGRTKPDVTAPDGVSTYAYGAGSFYGTSASSPHTAGAAALLKSADFSLNANQLQNKLESTALDLGPGGKDNEYGSGRIDVWAAYNTINQPPNTPILVFPPDGSTVDSQTSATLEVRVTDPDGDTMDVKFYNADNDELITVDSDILSGDVASISWNELSANTEYHWYAVSDDGEFSTQSATWSFTTMESLNIPPVADFTYSPTNPITLDVIQFTDISTDSDGDIVSWFWDFGDDISSTEQNPTHQYTVSGTYTVTLRILDDDGDIDSEEKIITVIEGALKIFYIDVGQGDSILIQTPENNSILIDAGKQSTASTVIDFLNAQSITTLKAFIASHPDADHIGGADEVIENFDVLSIYHPGYEKDTTAYQDFIAAAQNEGCPIYTDENLDSGDFINLSEVISCQILHIDENASNSNDASIVLKMDYDQVSFLFTGDISSDVEVDLIQNYDIDVDILKVAHHGSKYSTSDIFLDEATPSVSMISVGDNSYGHPTPETLDRLMAHDSLIYRTDLNGTITVTSSGNAWNISVEKMLKPPIADFTYAPTENITIDTEIVFIDASTDEDGFIESWLWDFGDGNTSSLQNPTHKYGDNGVYSVNLIVTDDDGKTDCHDDDISVSNIPPIAYIDMINPNPAIIGDIIFFTGYGTDSDGTILEWQWNSSIDGLLNSQSSFNISTMSSGIHTISFKVKDDDQEWSQDITQILIVNVPPIADFIYEPLNPTTQDTIYFNSTSYDLDGAIVNWTWSFDDTIAYGDRVTRQYMDDGIFSVKLLVQDNHGAIDEISQQITVLNVGPTANFSFEPAIPIINQTVQFLDASTDSDGDIVSYLWDFGDGNTSTVQNPQHVYSTCEAYIVKLLVTDDDNYTDEISNQIMTKIIFEEEILIGENEIDLENDTGLTLTINATNQTNITIERFSGNPTQEVIPNNITSVNNYINITVENESRIIWPIEIRIFYTQDDLNNSDLDENQLLGIYFWNNSSCEWSLYGDTGVNTEYNQNGYEGYCWANVWHLTILSLGGDTEPPSKVEGLTVTDAKDGKLDLAWSEATDNVAVDYYNIYRDGTSLTTINHPIISYQDTGLTNGQSYSYEVSAIDTTGNEGERSDPNSETPTATDDGDGGGGGGGGGGSPPSPPANQPPTADAGGSYDGVIGEAIQFNSSESTDDEEIVSYFWEFGDETNSTEANPTHAYSSAGTYIATLIVEDNEGVIDNDTAEVIISQPNKAPTAPEVTGETTGHRNEVITYSAVSTDEENDTIKYLFDWGDNTSDESDFVSNGTAVEFDHSWSSARKYIIEVYAYDNQTYSGSTLLTILIDICYIGDIGHLIDDDSDGVYDLFYCNATGNNTVIEQDENGNYLIDIDGDGKFDYTYNSASGIDAITTEGAEKVKSFFIWVAGLIIALIILLIIAVIVILYKKKCSKT